MVLCLGAFVVAADTPMTRAAGPGLANLTPNVLAVRQDVDFTSLATYRSGLVRTVAFARSRPEIFPASRPSGVRLLTSGDRAVARGAWKSMLEFTLALESLETYHADFHQLGDAKAKARSFHIAHVAFLAVYRFALEFIDLAESDPKLAVILNDPVEDLGLPAGAYDQYKFRFLNVVAATRFTAYALAGQALGTPEDASLAKATREDAASILAAGRGRGEVLTAANSLNVLRQLGARAFLPVQTAVSEWMGDTKVLRLEHSLIAPAQIETLRTRMIPGDIMLQRREWYLSNVGLPGFWSHAALYVGTPEERRIFFGGEEVRRWVVFRGEPSGELERLLERACPAARAATLLSPEQGHAQRVLEAISEGVVFTTLEHSAAADSVVVLRPRLDRVAIASALERGWGYVGRPYDFDFDFQTDSALVCTELIYKAFEPSRESPGLRLALEEILGRTAIPANAIARQFDTEFGTPAVQFDLVAFLDGQEKTGVAVEASLEEFRKSWRRPKWHVLVQEAGGGAAPK
jgi:hypothetical protein